MKRLLLSRLLLSLAASAILIACEPADNAAQTSASEDAPASSPVAVDSSESTGDVEDESARLNATRFLEVTLIIEWQAATQLSL